MPPVILPPPPIVSRPSTPNYRVSDNGNESPDKVITLVDGTQYLCYKMNVPGNVYTKGRCWRICRVKVVAVDYSSPAGYVSVNETSFEYPYGLDAYNFEIKDVLKYEYQTKY